MNLIFLFSDRHLGLHKSQTKEYINLLPLFINAQVMSTAYTFKVLECTENPQPKEYYLTFYQSTMPSMHDMVSLYDPAKKRTVLKPDVHATTGFSTTMNNKTPFRLEDLRISSTVRLCGRDLKVVEYATDNAKRYFTKKPLPASVDKIPEKDEEDVDVVVQLARSAGFAVGLKINLESPGLYSFDLELAGNSSNIDKIIRAAQERGFAPMTRVTKYVPPGEFRASMKLVGSNEEIGEVDGATSRLRRVKREQEQKRAYKKGNMRAPSFSDDGFVKFGDAVMLEHSQVFLACDMHLSTNACKQEDKEQKAKCVSQSSVLEMLKRYTEGGMIAAI